MDKPKLSRRRWLKSAAAASLMAIRYSASLAGEAGSMRPCVLVTRSGGDRATGYVMSNKIARRGGHLVCTWLDVQRQNCWAEIDSQAGEILRSGAVDKPGRDNHCGAALATDTDGTLHMLIGAHHGSFVHYRLPPDGTEWLLVEDGRAVGVSATYPSLVCDRAGTLHVLYRRETGGRDPHLVYCRRTTQGPWKEPKLLVRAAVREHSWLTGAIETDQSGRLHAVLSNTLPLPEQGPDARYYGASHLYSDDGGESWRQYGAANALALPADAAALDRIEGPAMPRERMENRYGGPSGPLNSYYHKMVLSNGVVDQHGRPWVIVHNILAGDAQVYRHETDGPWIGTALAGAVRGLLPGYQIRHCGQLARCGDGMICAVVTASPPAGPGWGDGDSVLVRLLIDANGRILQSELVRSPEPGMPHWLASLERYCPHAPNDKPALLFTRGVNAGGYGNNVNSVRTEVWLDS